MAPPQDEGADRSGAWRCRTFATPAWVSLAETHHARRHTRERIERSSWRRRLYGWLRSIADVCGDALTALPNSARQWRTSCCPSRLTRLVPVGPISSLTRGIAPILLKIAEFYAGRDRPIIFAAAHRGPALSRRSPCSIADKAKPRWGLKSATLTPKMLLAREGS